MRLPTMRFVDNVMPTRHNHHHHHHHLARATSTRSNLGPLTTTFTPPPHCSGAVITCPTCSSASQGQTCFGSNPSSKGGVDDTACWPRATQYPPTPPLVGLGFYSPGLICPTGYASACSAVSRGPRDDPGTTILSSGPIGGTLQFPLVAGETAVGCCPIGFTCAAHTANGKQTCHSMAGSTRVHLMTCDSGTMNEIPSLTLPYPVKVAAANTVTVSTIDIYAPLIQINWQRTDRYTTASATTTASPITSSDPFILESAAVVPTTPTTPASVTVPATASPPASTSTAPPTTPLTLGAKAGIVVSCGILFLCLSSLIFYLWTRKRHLQTPTKFDAAGIPKSAQSPSPNPSDISCTTSLTSPATNFTAHSLPGLPSPSHPRPPTMIYELGPGDGRENRIVDTSHDGMITLDTDAVRFGRGLGIEDDLESPIDGTSPFRLRRGNTLPKRRERGSWRGEEGGNGRESRGSWGVWENIGGWREREGERDGREGGGM
ncbi:hypothetical protein BCR34DRAFT_184373 [Clohesyomyces aquaticus]|uniref:Uncharacterized protein n=1 Tax=Clohesyomyces aquaticus TaxID=1231657 RepID=A0A1Y1YE54_9PLEO|nr:hypothetical protein BCR34DRAFT_184373 [Clohesyomyces aquaticus]